uniref:Uncharacterized protein n=1 Tax=Pelusios castaneus TaxID=367368 RepID=A0A8C8RG29_9SAUR
GHRGALPLNTAFKESSKHIIALPIATLHYSDMLDIVGKNVNEPPLRAAIYIYTRLNLDYSMAILFILANQWLLGRGCGVTTAISSLLLLLLYCFYDHFVYVMIGCLFPFVRRIPLGECRSPFRNEDRWAWILTPALGITYYLFMIKYNHIPTMQYCTFYLLAFLVTDAFFKFISPLLTQSRESIMEVTALSPSDSALNEKIPLVLKVPNLNSPPLDCCGKACNTLGLGNILIPGFKFLVTYCHKFDIEAVSSKVYYVASTIAYGIGLLGTLAVRAFALYTYHWLFVALRCQELRLFWLGSDFEETLPHLPLEKALASYPHPSNESNTPTREDQFHIQRAPYPCQQTQACTKNCYLGWCLGSEA